MNRLSQFVFFFLAFCVVASAPAIVNYFIESSRWQSVQKLPESIDALNESHLEFIDVLRPFSNPKELEKFKNDQKKFQEFRDSVKRAIEYHSHAEESLISRLTGDFFSYVLGDFIKTNAGLYLNLGFFISTIFGFALLIRLKSRINKKISDERVKMEVTKKKELGVVEERAWKLKLRVAELEGEVQRMTAGGVTPVLTTKRPRNGQGDLSSRQETKPPERVESIAKTKEWKLFLVSNDSEQGEPMPQKQRSFMRVLNLDLKNELAAIDSKILYCKLRRLGNLSPADRAIKMDKISGGSIFQGWYKMRLGPFRILIKFDDEKGELRFFLATHEIYRKIHRG